MIEKSIGSRIRNLRESRNMTKGELGAILGMDEDAVGEIESEKGPVLGADVLRSLCETFGVYPRFLLYDTDEEFWKRAMGFGEGGGGYIAGFLDTPMGPAVLREEIGEEGIGVLKDLTRLSPDGVCRAKTLVDDLLKIADYRKGT